MCGVLTCARACNRNPVLDDLPGRLGVPELRDHQRQAIEAVAAGRDVLAVVPTGSGKTEAFLGAGLMLGRVTLIVSPLRSLMRDQFERCKRLGLPVRLWNSDVKDSHKSETIRLLNHGWSGMVYTTPESLKARPLSGALSGRVGLAVIDEAHCCLRERGFRLPYVRLGTIIDRVQPEQRFGCTATLPAHDCATLVRSLHLHDPQIITLPVTRSNLEIGTTYRDPAVLRQILSDHRGESGIVFCATVRTAEALFAELHSQGWSVTLYHGRMPKQAKNRSQTAFMDGAKNVAIVTDAFLLGIDKSDIRFTVHYDHPKSIEDWVQAFGRAGRDDLPASVWGCFHGSDEGQKSRLFLLRATYPPVADLRAVWEYLSTAPFRDETAADIGKKTLGRRGKFSGGTILTSLQRYELADAQIHPDDGRRRIYCSRGDFSATDWTPYQHEAQDAMDRFEMLCELANLPDDQIPGAIDRYFGAAA